MNLKSINKLSIIFIPFFFFSCQKLDYFKNQDENILLTVKDEIENIELMINEINLVLHNKDFEIIVVDDDSPDGTWKKVKEIQKERKNLKLIRRKTKKGLTSALNEGIAKSSGEIILWTFQR